MKLSILLITASMLAACTDASNSSQKEESKHISFLYNFSTNSLEPHVDTIYVPLRAEITETLVRLDVGCFCNGLL